MSDSAVTVIEETTADLADALAGGTKAWVEEGRPVVTGPDPA